MDDTHDQNRLDVCRCRRQFPALQRTVAGHPAVYFDGPAGKMAYAQWFTMRDGRIARLEVVYDPRPFLQQAGG